MSEKNNTPIERLDQFVSEHFALVVVGGLMVLFGGVALIGPKPPPRPQEAVTVTLSPEDRQLLIEIRTALAQRGDAGYDAGHGRSPQLP
jgi:hypothetical protein